MFRSLKRTSLALTLLGLSVGCDTNVVEPKKDVSIEYDVNITDSEEGICSYFTSCTEIDWYHTLPRPFCNKEGGIFNGLIIAGEKNKISNLEWDASMHLTEGFMARCPEANQALQYYSAEIDLNQDNLIVVGTYQGNPLIREIFNNDQNAFDELISNTLIKQINHEDYSTLLVTAQNDQELLDLVLLVKGVIKFNHLSK